MEARQRVEAQDVRLISGPERAELAEPVVFGRIQRGHDQCVDLADAGRDGQPEAVVEVAHVEERVGLPVVAAQRDVVGAVGEDHRDEISQVLAGGALTDEDPHPLAPLLFGFFELRALVVGLHARCEICVQRGAPEPGA